MQPEERDPQQTFQQKLSIRIMALVQDFISAEKAGQRSKVRLDPGLEITDHIMFSVTFAVCLIVRIARVFAQDQLKEPSGAL